MCWGSLVIGSAVRSSTRLQRPPGTTDEPLHSLHLIASAQCDQFSGDCLLNAAEHSPEIRPKNEASTNEIRFVLHLVDASRDFPQGVTAKQVVHPSPVQLSANTRPEGTSALSMVQTHFPPDRPVLPPLRPRPEARNEIDPPEAIGR